MATSINLGTFYDGFSGINYTCYLIHDTPTRSGDNVTITNLKARIVSQASWGTEGRMAVSFSLPNGTSRVSNGTIANAYSYPTDNTVTLSSSITISNLNTSFTYGISFSDTGYGTTWNSNYSKSFSGSISCPARTYSVTYNANGGSGAPAAQSKTYNVTLALSGTVPTRTGYTFLGWATSSGGAVAYGAGASYSGNADLALYAVWQAQVSTISSAADVTLGNACNVKWTPKVSTNKYRLKFTISNFDSGYLPSSSTFVAGSSSDITYTSYTVPINGVAQKITTATTGTMTVTLYTYDSGGTLLGSDAKTFTVTVPASCKPSVNTYTITQTSSSTVINNWGVYVAGYSKARCQATGTAQYGATITNVTVSGDHNASGTTSLDSTSGILTAGTKTFTFTVTDSRGMTSTAVSRQATVYSYTAPAITGFTAERDATSVTVVKALGSWTYSTVASNNSVTATLKYKQSTGSTWSTASGSITSGTTKTLTEVFTDSVSYNLQLTVTDSIGNSDTRTVFLPTRFVWMHQPVGGNGVAFGKTSETGHFEVNYPIEAYGNVKTTGTYLGSGSVEYIKGTQTASTNAWTGVTKDTALYDGKMIMYVLPYAGTSTGATLNLTLAGGGTTGAKAIYRYGGTTQITTHYAAGSRILLIYDSANNRWNSSAWYDSNTTYSSKAAASGGTAVSLVTTGEKYTWNNKQNAGLGTPSASDFNSITTSGVYWINPSVTTGHNPSAGNYGYLEVLATTGLNGGAIVQKFSVWNSSIIYERLYANDAWNTWHLISGQEVYSASGYIVSGNNGLAGYGIAEVCLMSDKVRVDFAFNVTNSGSGGFAWGINSIRLNMINSNIPSTITPLGSPCGTCTYYYGGAIYGNLTGFGGTVNVVDGYPQLWGFGRMYDSSGANGMWGENSVPSNTYITGTAYGKISS